MPWSHATDGSPTTFVSLPTLSSIVTGFSGGFVFDGAGLDRFISGVGGSDALAEVSVSADFGAPCTLPGQATTATVSGFDLASIGHTVDLNAVKVVGLDNRGGAPGFDLAFVQGLEGSGVISPTPKPGSLALVYLALRSAGGAARRG